MARIQIEPKVVVHWSDTIGTSNVELANLAKLANYKFPDGWTPTEVCQFLKRHGFTEIPPFNEALPA